MKITLIGLALAAFLSLPASPARALLPNPSAGAMQLPTPTPSPTPADGATTPATPPTGFSMKPTTIQAGRTRDVTISVENGTLEGYELQTPAASSGVTYVPAKGELTNGKKNLTFKVSVDEDADLGPVTVKIAKAGATPDTRTFDLEVTEFRVRRVSRGPTPDDMTQVDAMWNVLPYKVAKANFGRRAADSFYAIEVYIGNNSGFDLQLVGVGFETALGATRTVNKDGIPLKYLLDEKGKPVLDEYGNKLIEAVRENGEYITDASGNQTYRPLKKYQLPTSDHRLVRGTIEKDQLYGSRALTMNLIGGVGTFVSGFIPFYRNANPKANFSTFSSIINGQLKEGFGLAAPDLTVNQLNRLENTVLHEGLTVVNNTQERTIVFFPRHVVGLDETERGLIEKGNMRPLMDKLGELVLVGKPIISFSNREIVAARPQPIDPPAPPTTPAAPAPTAGGFERADKAEGGNAPGKSLTVTGTNMNSVTAVTIGGVPAEIVQAGRTDNQIMVRIPENPVSGKIVLTTTGGKTVEVPGGDFKAPPRITEAKPATDNAPGSTVVIKGANLAEAKKVIFGTAESTRFVGTNMANEITVVIPERAESAKLTVETDSGKAPSPEPFRAKPVIDKITPEAGAGEPVVIEGLNLEKTVEVQFGSYAARDFVGGIENKKVTIKVPERAENGQLTVVSSDGTRVPSGSDKTFKLIPPPTIAGIVVGDAQVTAAPTATASAAAGATITIHGKNLKRVKEVKFEGAEAVTAFEPSSTDEKLVVKVPAAAKTGAIKLTTHGGSSATTGVLTVTPQP